MKGHIRERSPGHWAIILDVPDPQTGKRRRKWHSFKGTKREAQVESARLIAAIQGGTYLEPSKTTLAQFFERWLEHMRSQISPKSHARYSELARKNIAPLMDRSYSLNSGPPQYLPPTPRPSRKAAGTVPVACHRRRSRTCTASLSKLSGRL